MSRTHLPSAFVQRLQQVPENVILALIVATVCVCDIVAAWLLFVK